MSVIDGQGVNHRVEVAVKSHVPQICQDALGEIACPNALAEVQMIVDEAGQYGYGVEWAHLESRKRVGEMCTNFCTEVGLSPQELAEKYQGVELEDGEPLPKLIALE